MTRDVELHDRFVEAAEAYTVDVAKALSSLEGTVRAHRRRRISTSVMAAVAVGAVLAVGWTAVSRPHDPEIPAEAPVRITPPPPGVTTHQTVAGLEAKVLTQIEQDAQRSGRTLAVPRILAVTYLSPGQTVSFNGGTAVEDSPAWAVEFSGDTIVCSSWCSLHPGGLIVFDDQTGEERDGLRLDPVCEPFQLETPTESTVGHGSLPPCLPNAPAAT